MPIPPRHIMKTLGNERKGDFDEKMKVSKKL